VVPSAPAVPPRAGPGLQQTTRSSPQLSGTPAGGAPPVATQRQPPRNCPTPTAVGPTWGGPTIGRHRGERNPRHGQLLSEYYCCRSTPTDPLSENETQAQRTKAVFSSIFPNSKFFFRHLHGDLNLDEIKNALRLLSVNGETNLMNLIML